MAKPLEVTVFCKSRAGTIVKRSEGTKEAVVETILSEGVWLDESTYIPAAYVSELKF